VYLQQVIYFFLGAAFTFFVGVAFLALGFEPTFLAAAGFLAAGDFLAAAGFLAADYVIQEGNC
jgi:hypothetical protein